MEAGTDEGGPAGNFGPYSIMLIIQDPFESVSQTGCPLASGSHGMYCYQASYKGEIFRGRAKKASRQLEDFWSMALRRDEKGNSSRQKTGLASQGKGSPNQWLGPARPSVGQRCLC